MALKPTSIGVGLAILLLAILFVGMQLLTDVSRPTESMDFERQVIPEQLDLDGTFDSPDIAAVTEARELGIEDAHADKFVLIFADDELIDLRVRVNGSACRWVGVMGFAQEDRIAWTAAGSGSGQPCG